MQFDRLSKKLNGISDASKKGNRVQDLFKLMTNQKEIWFEAYANIYSNDGALTKGIKDNTLDSFSEQRVDEIMERLKKAKYRFTPARRTYKGRLTVDELPPSAPLCPMLGRARESENRTFDFVP